MPPIDFSELDTDHGNFAMTIGVIPKRDVKVPHDQNPFSLVEKDEVYLVHVECGNGMIRYGLAETDGYSFLRCQACGQVMRLSNDNLTKAAIALRRALLAGECSYDFLNSPERPKNMVIKKDDVTKG